MFTGLIQEIGTAKTVKRDSGNLILDIAAVNILSDIELGDSVNIQGACQTVVARSQNSFVVNTVSESLDKTNLGRLAAGDRVNLELAMRPTDRFGGHIVTGHVDCTGSIISLSRLGGSWEMRVEHPAEYAGLVVPRGSVAINGISLTVADSGAGWFRVAIIPHTWEKTTLHLAQPGDEVNLEFDILGKYIQQLINPLQSRDEAMLQALRRAGF